MFTRSVADLGASASEYVAGYAYAERALSHRQSYPEAVKLDTWLALVAFATVLGGLVLVALGMPDRRRAAAKVERNGPSGHAAGRARAEAASLAVNPAPPAWDRVATLDWAHSAEVRRL